MGKIQRQHARDGKNDASTSKVLGFVYLLVWIFKSVPVLTRTSKVERETLRAKDIKGSVSGAPVQPLTLQRVFTGSHMTFHSSSGRKPSALASMHLLCYLCVKPLNVSDEILKANLSLKIDNYISFNGKFGKKGSFFLHSSTGFFFSTLRWQSHIIYGV